MISLLRLSSRRPWHRASGSLLTAIGAMVMGVLLAAPAARADEADDLPRFSEHPEFWQKVRQRLRDSGWAEDFRKRARLAAAVEKAAPPLEDDMAGRFVLPGSGGTPVAVGTPPRWHENPTSPHNPEFLWTLNRMYHWPRLATASVIKGDDRLVERILFEMDDWIANCPVPLIEEGEYHEAFYAETPWRTFEAGLRMDTTWPKVVEALADSPRLDPAKLERIVHSFQDHGRVLYKVCPSFWPKADHNHYLTENAGLLRLSLLFPEIPESPKWTEHARREIIRCAEVQLTPEGGQIEGCPGYHNICLRSFAETLLVARRHGIEFPASFTDRLRGGLDYTLHTLRPSGTLVPFGDSDPTTLPALKAALLTAVALDQWEQVKQLRTFAPEEAFRQAAAEVLMLVPDPESWFSRLEKLTPPEPLPLTNWQRELGQAMMRTSWTRDAASVAITCRSPVANGHAHMDTASFDFTAFGRPLLVDPARFTYAETQDRKDFKSATWHNALTVNNAEPFEYIDTWNFGLQRAGILTRLSTGEGWAAAECRQENFSPVLHRRLVILLDSPPCLVVLDALDGLKPADTVQRWFHLDSTTARLAPSGCSAATHDDGVANVQLTFASGVEASLLPGRISDALDSARPSTRLRLTDHGGPAQRVFPTLVLPSQPGTAAPQDLAISANIAGTSIRIALHGSARSINFEWSADGTLNASNSNPKPTPSSSQPSPENEPPTKPPAGVERWSREGPGGD